MIIPSSVMPELKILFWWVMFAGTHIVGSSIPVRSLIIAKTGSLGFKGLYSLAAIATFVPLCITYGAHKHTGAQLFAPGPSMQWATQILMLVALIVLIQGSTTEHPMTMQAELTGKYSSQAKGIQRVCRHPQNFSFALFGLAHALSNPFVGDLIFFGGFIVYAMLSAIHQDRRSADNGPLEVALFQSDTSFIPFAAILTGKQHLAISEYNRIGVIASVVLLVLLRLFHHRLFGGF